MNLFSASRWAEPPCRPGGHCGAPVWAPQPQHPAARWGGGSGRASPSPRDYPSRRESCGSPSAAAAPKEVPILGETAVVGWGLTEGCQGAWLQGVGGRGQGRTCQVPGVPELRRSARMCGAPGHPGRCGL